MASRALTYWRSLVKSREVAAQRFSTATAPRMRPFAPAAAELPDHHLHDGAKQWWASGEFVPVFVLLGMITFALSLGSHTAKQHLAYAPDVRVHKKRRERVMEVEDPDRVAHEAERFIKKSFFRRVAAVQDFDAVRSGISDPARIPDPLNPPMKVEDLKTVGVNPKKV